MGKLGHMVLLGLAWLLGFGLIGLHAQTLPIPVPFNEDSDTTTDFLYSIIGGIGGPTTTIVLEVAVTNVQDTLVATYALASDHLDFTNTVVISGSPAGAASGECSFLFANAQTVAFAMECAEMDGTEGPFTYTPAITNLVLNAQSASSSLTGTQSASSSSQPLSTPSQPLFSPSQPPSSPSQPPSSPSQPPSSPSQSPSSPSGSSANSGHIGAIIGGAVGGGIALILLLLTLFCLRRRRLRNLSHNLPPSVFGPPGPPERSIMHQSQGSLQPLSNRIGNIGFVNGGDDMRSEREMSESTQSNTASTFKPEGYTNGQLGNRKGNDNHENWSRPASTQYTSPAPSLSPPQAVISEDDALIQSISRTVMAQASDRPFRSTPNQPPRLVNNPPTAHTDGDPTQVAGSETTGRDMQLAGALVNLIRAVRGEGGESSGTGIAPPAYTSVG